jgi:hypothetical protein
MAVLNKIRNALISFDFYSTGASMTFKKSTTFKTLYGGLFSIFLIAIMSIFTFLNLRKVIDKEIKSTMISKTYENVFNSTKEHEFMKNGPNFIFEYFAVLLPHFVGLHVLPPNLFYFKMYKQYQTAHEGGGGVYGVNDLSSTT